MNKKVLGTLLIAFGGYLAIVNTIISIIFNRVHFSGGGPIGDNVPINFWNYWLNWVILYGGATILIAGVGLYLIFLGIRIFRMDKKSIRNESLTITEI